MAKALTLTDETMAEVPPIPQAAKAATPKVKQARAEDKREPLQVRWPGEDIKAAKLAAIHGDFPSVSEFMLACFHAYMQRG